MSDVPDAKSDRPVGSGPVTPSESTLEAALAQADRDLADLRARLAPQPRKRERLRRAIRALTLALALALAVAFTVATCGSKYDAGETAYLAQLRTDGYFIVDTNEDALLEDGYFSCVLEPTERGAFIQYSWENARRRWAPTVSASLWDAAHKHLCGAR